MRLITFGCSYTQGIGLDGLDHSAHQYYTNPSEAVLKIKSASNDAWPHLLADKLNLECVNLGRGGSSPKFVFQMIREFQFNNDDIVIVQWPNPDRNVIWEDRLDSDQNYFITIYDELCPMYEEQTEYYKNYHTLFDARYNNAMYIENTHAYLKDKCKELYSISDNPEMSRNKLLMSTFSILSEVEEFFKEGSQDDMCSDGHPGKSYHENFTNRMWEKIKS